MVVHVVRSLRSHENCGKDIITEAGGSVVGRLWRVRSLTSSFVTVRQLWVASAYKCHALRLAEVQELPDDDRIWLLSNDSPSQLGAIKARHDRAECSNEL
jgi:hypothetical protein